MLKLYDDIYHAKSKIEALNSASGHTGFSKENFKCEVVKEPVKTGLFKKDPGEYHCWYEYNNFDSDKRIDVVDSNIYFDTIRKKILVTRFGFKADEINYSDLVDYEILVVANNKTFTVGNKNKALKGAILFGTVGAIVGASDSKTESETVEFAEIIIRLKFASKESFEIMTCNNRIATEDSEWRDALDQSKVIAEYLNGIIDVQANDMNKNDIVILKAYRDYLEGICEDIEIDILPTIINNNTLYMAYTDNDELEYAIKNGYPAKLHYQKKLFDCENVYIKALLLHEFTHIFDFVKIRKLDNLNFVMSTYSEFNAKIVEIKNSSLDTTIKLNSKICGEDGYTTPQSEIDDNIEILISIIKCPKKNIDENKLDEMQEAFIKYFSGTLGMLSYFEITESEYFNRCFKKFDKFGFYDNLVELYDELIKFTYKNDEAYRIVSSMTKIYIKCFE